MDDFQLLIDLHKDGDRQGPGGAAATRTAIALSGLAATGGLRIADVGCGTGSATLVLAQVLNAHITAVDLVPAFLGKLEREAVRADVAERIETYAGSMEALPFDEAELDAIWSEGAIYNIGFERGVAAWRRFLKPGGILAVSELTWLTGERPAELQAHWEGAYSEVDTASTKIAILERQGFSPLGYFALPESGWLENFYCPLEERFADFLKAQDGSEAARALVDAERHEISLYRRYKAYYGYGYYVAKRTRD